jgi:conjugal transfer pilus assembly protein TraD
MSSDVNFAIAVAFLLAAAILQQLTFKLSSLEALAIGAVTAAVGLMALASLWFFRSADARKRSKARKLVAELPVCLKHPAGYPKLGRDRDLGLTINLPNHIRLRHTHILGATGAGKTESVILNLLGQDIRSGAGAIILDGKGDDSFLSFLKLRVPEQNLRVFDLSDPNSDAYDPMQAGSPAEAAQRLFSSLNWSEEYYKSKASAALQRIFQTLGEKGSNPSLPTVAEVLSTSQLYHDAVVSEGRYSAKAAAADYQELSGLRDQVNLLCSGHLRQLFSGAGPRSLDPKDAFHGTIIYFRLQSLLSRQLAGSVGRLVINHLSFLAGSAHRSGNDQKATFVPVYLDEFATFACEEFADLIAKARSAGFALHFSHQSVGDLDGVRDGFLSQIMDNSATKIVLRVNDPDTAEIFSRAFGTQKAERITKRVSNATDLDLAESDGMGSLREVREFRASPDLLKTLPTGVGAVLIAHGEDTPHGASSVFQIQFPRLS